MTFKGTVSVLSDTGEHVQVELINVRRRSAAAWQGYGPPLKFSMTHLQSKAFPIGREVEIKITPKVEIKIIPR